MFFYRQSGVLRAFRENKGGKFLILSDSVFLGAGPVTAKSLEIMDIGDLQKVGKLN